MVRKAEQAESTRQALVEAARELFTERGYADTPIEEVVRRANVTKGALYHHFRSKHDLFRAVFETVQRELVQTIATAASTAPDPWGQVQAGCEAYLDAARAPAVQRIVLLDAPAVLGWETWRAIDAEHSLGLVRRTVRAAMDDGTIGRQPEEPLAHLLLGALNEAALTVARADDPASAQAEFGAAVTRLLEGLRARR